MPSQVDQKKIAVNTIFLYFRMLFVMGISLYTSRIILKALGITDYGIYNVVGGVVAMFSFINASLSGATSRFITFELGKNNKKRLEQTFRTALTFHLFIAILILLLGETLGLWLLENKLVIPFNRMNAARITYQLSILCCMINVVQVPYNATIIAHEKMKAFAYISIIEVLLKLMIAFAIANFNFDKLIMYAILVFFVQALISIIYSLYGYKNFQECRFKLLYDKALFKPIFSFSCWNLYGYMCIMLRTEGINIMQNTFFGPVVNAATGLANSVQNAIRGFAENFILASRPQIVKSYANKEIIQMRSLVLKTGKFSFLLLFYISFPLFLEMKYVLNLWLKEVPPYTANFCKLILILNLISTIYRTIGISIESTGRIRTLNFITGTILVLVIPISYIMLRLGYSPNTPFIINIFLLFISNNIALLILNKYIPEFNIITSFYKEVFINSIFTILPAIIIPSYIHFSMPEGFLRLILVCLSSAVIMPIFVYIIAIDFDTKRKIRALITKKIKNLWKN